MKLKLPTKTYLLIVLSLSQVNLHAISYVGIATPALAATATRYLNESDDNNDPHETTGILYNSQFIIDNEADNQAALLDAIATKNLDAVATTGNYTNSYQNLQKFSHPISSPMDFNQAWQHEDEPEEHVNYKKARLEQSQRLLQLHKSALPPAKEPENTNGPQAKSKEEIQKIRDEEKNRKKQEYRKKWQDKKYPIDHNNLNN